MMTSPLDGNNPAFVAAVKNAEAIFITGGDQSNYVRYWPGFLGSAPNDVRDAVNTALSNGAAIDGTSAGMAALGQVAYAALLAPPGGGNLYSKDALLHPSSPVVGASLINGFGNKTSPALTNIVTETHFQPGDNDPQGRMGRLITFMANMADGIPPGLSGTPHGIAASKSTGIDIEQNGDATIVANPDVRTPTFAYFVTAPSTDPQIGNNKPLTWQGIDVIRVAVDGQFNVLNWILVAGPSRKYTINVNNGLLSVEGNNDFY